MLCVSAPVEGAMIVSHLSSDDLWVGRTLTLQCDITRGTHISYDWLKDGTPLHSSFRTSRLTIPSLSLHHTGDYQCVASNRLNDTTVYNSSSDVISVQVKGQTAHSSLISHIQCVTQAERVMLWVFCCF